MYRDMELKTVISLTMHKSIYRHMHLWLEIDLDKGVLEGLLRNLKLEEQDYDISR